jgi:hypothetical protein
MLRYHVQSNYETTLATEKTERCVAQQQIDSVDLQQNGAVGLVQ